MLRTKYTVDSRNTTIRYTQRLKIDSEREIEIEQTTKLLLANILSFYLYNVLSEHSLYKYFDAHK